MAVATNKRVLAAFLNMRRPVHPLKGKDITYVITQQLPGQFGHGESGPTFRAQLDGHWDGGRKLAEWYDGKLYLHDRGPKSRRFHESISKYAVQVLGVSPIHPGGKASDKTPRSYGYEAAKAGKVRVPVHDAAFMKTLPQGAPIGTSASAMTEWLAGWDDANIGAPIPGWTAAEEKAIRGARTRAAPTPKKRTSKKKPTTSSPIEFKIRQDVTTRVGSFGKMRTVMKPSLVEGWVGGEKRYLLSRRGKSYRPLTVYYRSEEIGESQSLAKAKRIAEAHHKGSKSSKKKISLSDAILRHAQSAKGTLRVGQKIGGAKITVVGTHTIQSEKEGWKASDQIPFIDAEGKSMPSHIRALREGGEMSEIERLSSQGLLTAEAQKMVEKPKSALAARELKEMKTLLRKYGWQPADAQKLQDEGMGPEELKGRLQHPPHGIGGLSLTHGLKKARGKELKLPATVKVAGKTLRVEHDLKYQKISLYDGETPMASGWPESSLLAAKKSAGEAVRKRAKAEHALSRAEEAFQEAASKFDKKPSQRDMRRMKKWLDRLDAAGRDLGLHDYAKDHAKQYMMRLSAHPQYVGFE